MEDPPGSSGRSYWPWSATSSNANIAPGDDDDAATNRKSLSQILRYISTMQTQSANDGHSFVRSVNEDNYQVPFFDADEGTPIIFTT